MPCTTYLALSALKTLQHISDDFEIIIVNDGSRDRTGEISDRLAKDYDEVRVVHNQPNLGYGGALQQGFRESSKTWVFYTDGDGQFDFEEIDKLIPLLDKYDIVGAYRVDRKDPLVRKLNGYCWTTLINIVFRLWLRDIDCAFKIFPRQLFKEIDMKSSGALIDAEILARARRRNYKIGQVGVHHYARTAGQQTGANMGAIIKAFQELFKLWWDIRKS